MSNRKTTRLLFFIAVFTSAFLLFQMQLILGKYLLPWFGGGSAVWATCLVFFQLLLLGGYLYAHWLASRPKAVHQGNYHLAFLALAATCVFVTWSIWGSPILPSAELKPAPAAALVPGILKLLLLSAGLPFLLLSTTGPLLQSWFGRLNAGAEAPYFLYALSNAGSMLGLLTYPALFEPALSLSGQSRIWGAGFALFLFTCAACSWSIRHTVTSSEDPPIALTDTLREQSSKYLWFVLPMLASAMLFATTNFLTQDVAPVPLLWVLPLTAYLLSFVFTFSSRSWYSRNVFHALFAAGAVITVVALFRGTDLNVIISVLVFLGMLFISCMVCHGELALRKPTARDLTRFYLILSAGGACGGLFVAFIAPMVFPAVWEYQISLWGIAITLGAILFFDKESWLNAGKRYLTFRFAAGGGLLLLTIAFYLQLTLDNGVVLHRERNFYGALTVKQHWDNEMLNPYIELLHGRITHGLQMTRNRKVPTSYYDKQSGAGLALLTRRNSGPMRVGVVGLGVGTIAAYGRAGDVYRFYEINPAVIRLARGEGGYFSYLQDSAAQIQVAQGDARLSLEKEGARHELGNFDVLLVDAFNGDSIPVHLLTREAMGLYLSHLRNLDAIIGVHISNKAVDLGSVVAGLAQFYRLKATLVEMQVNGVIASDWVLLTRGSSLDVEAIRNAGHPLQEIPGKTATVWTDNYSNLLTLLTR